MPVPPEVTVIQVTSLTAVRVQLVALAVTVNVPVVAFSMMTLKFGERVKLHGPVWVMVKVLVPMVIVAVRPTLVGFGSTV